MAASRAPLSALVSIRRVQDLDTPAPQADQNALLYLDLLKRCLSGLLVSEEFQPPQPRTRVERLVNTVLSSALRPRGVEMVRRVAVDVEQRVEGRDWPARAETMIGMRRLDNLQFCLTDVLRQDVPGDVIETGVWRGGATILMRAVLKAYGDVGRVVWVADSFQGLPKPDVASFPADAGDEHWTQDALAVSVDEVRANFATYQLLDDRVHFLAGWFRDTLPTAPIERLSLIRLDGDMYESTMVALRALYPKLSVGGYVIVDDYGAIPACRLAVEDFRAENGIVDPIEWIDWTGVYWRRSAG